MSDRKRAIQTAKGWLESEPLFLDTETTGLGNHDEIVEIAVVDTNGEVLLDTLVKPTIAIPYGAYRVHGIGDSDVTNAPTFPQVIPDLRKILQGRTVIIYGANYDTRMMEQSATAHSARIIFGVKRYHCAMELYAAFYGAWNDYRGSYTWQKLGNAARQCGIKIPDDLHRARADTELTRQIVRYMAAAK